MERKKKREKSFANGAEIDSAAGQTGDVHQRHREAEQQGNAKRLAASCVPSSESPTQPFLASLNWAFTPQHPVQQTPQQPTQASIPQPHVLPQQQQASQQGLQGGTQQSLPPGQQLQNPEHSGQNAGAGHFPFHPGAADSNWQASSYGGAQGMGGTVPSFNHPSGFGFPPPPYPGLWDPASWWAHNTHQQAVFPYPFPGYGGGYAYPFPPATQRGFIKTPPGLSQKHRRLWEAQSMENVQLWAIVGRAEAEISCQRAKILKLEGDLQTIKAHQDALMEASVVANAPQSARRGRRKKASPAPVATMGLTFSQPKRSRAQGRKAASSRPNANKTEIANDTKEMESEEKDKSTLTYHIPGLVNRTTQDHDQKSSSLTVGLNRNEMGVERNSHKRTVECQGADNDNPRLTGEKDDLDYGQLTQNSPFRTNLPVGAGKDKSCEQNMEMKEAPIISFLKSAGNVDKQALISGDSAFKSECTGMMRSNDWSGADGSGTPRNIMLGARLQAHYDTVGMERSNEIESGKSMPGWQYPREDGSDEQDEVGASGQDDDEADDDDETTLDDIHSGKVGNYMVLDSTAMSKEMTTLNRW